jgi:CBS domain containing-hemolysin-like protein
MSTDIHPFLPAAWSIPLVLILVVLNGLFVAAEFALVRSQSTKLKSIEHKTPFGVKSSLKLMENLDLSLSVTQLGITIVSLILGWFGEKTFQGFFYSMLSGIEERYAFFASHIIATSLALLLITILHVVLGEMVAKSVAIRYPETTLRYLSGPTLVFAYICTPVIKILAGCSRLVLRIFGITPLEDGERAHSMSELSMLVTHSSEKGKLDKIEEEMLQGVFGFSETVAREIMTPRTDVISVPLNASLENLVQIAVSSGFSRLPVLGESIDDIQGVIVVRDLLPYVHNVRKSSEKEFNIRRLMREPYFVPGTKSISDLLNEFKRRKTHIAFVLDEHGGIDGVISLEDIIEEIVGDIYDESDVPERDVIIKDDGVVLVDGGVLVADINDQFDFEIPEGDYDTIAGFIYTSLGRLPRSGDEIALAEGGDISVNGVILKDRNEEEEKKDEDEEVPPIYAQITVEKVSGRRIEQVRLEKLQRTIGAESDAELSASDKKVADKKAAEAQGK